MYVQLKSGGLLGAKLPVIKLIKKGMQMQSVSYEVV